MTTRGHLRLVPKPLAKCGAISLYPTPRRDGMNIWRTGKTWRLEHVRSARMVDLEITTEELRDLVEQGTLLLEMDADDER